MDSLFLYWGREYGMLDMLGTLSTMERITEKGYMHESARLCCSLSGIPAPFRVCICSMVGGISPWSVDESLWLGILSFPA